MIPAVNVRIEAQPETGLVWWLPLLLAVAGLLGTVAVLALRGRPGTGLRRPIDRLSESFGLAPWCAVSVGIALWSLLVAFLGFVWDVAWHADLGRDTLLFTPPHTMILVGLAGIGVAAGAAVALASVDRADVGLTFGRLRLPWSAVPLGLMALGALLGFPLDDWWHRTYGIDVTMWSPTHLLMIGGASLTPLAAWLLLAEATGGRHCGNRCRRLSERLATATLLGLSTFQLEFDLGIPQWQALYQPLLIAVAMGIGLVAAREALGRGAALRVTFGFLAARGAVALLLGGPFGLSVPRFPLYLGGALVVEFVYGVGGHRLSGALRTLLAGVGLGTVGLAVEWGWTHLWGLEPWQPRLLGAWWVVLATALLAALLGGAVGRAVAHAERLAPVGVVGLAVLALGALVVVPLPRHGSSALATVVAVPAGPEVPAITREGTATVERPMLVRVHLDPATTADGADSFRVIAWQGGDVVIRPLRRVGAGEYTTTAPIPTGGTWKSLVFLSRGDVVAAVPVSFPADPQYSLAPIVTPVTTPRITALAPASTYLTRESHGGAPLPAVFAVAAFLLMTTAWAAALVGAAAAVQQRLPGQRTRVGPAPAAAL